MDQQMVSFHHKADADGKIEKGYWLNNTKNNYRKVGLWVTGRVFSKHVRNWLLSSNSIDPYKTTVVVKKEVA